MLKSKFEMQFQFRKRFLLPISYESSVYSRYKPFSNMQLLTFFPFCGLLLYPDDGVLCCMEVFYFCEIQFTIFCCCCCYGYTNKVLFRKYFPVLISPSVFQIFCQTQGVKSHAEIFHPCIIEIYAGRDRSPVSFFRIQLSSLTSTIC